MRNYQRLPLFPLHAVLFPHMGIPLHIFEERYRIMIQHCIETDSPFGIVLINSGTEVSRWNGVQTEMASLGTLARIERYTKSNDGRYQVQAIGESCFHIEEVYEEEPYYTARIKPVWDKTDDPLQVYPVYDAACALFKKYLEALFRDENQNLGSLNLPNDPSVLASVIGMALQITLARKQTLLAARSVLERLNFEVEIMVDECKTLDILDLTANSGVDELMEQAERSCVRVDPSYSKYIISRN